MIWNPASIVRNVAGVVHGVSTGDVVQTVASGLKLAKSAVPGADFVPGLEDFVDGVVDEVLDTAIDVASDLDIDNLDAVVSSVGDAFSGAGSAAKDLADATFEPVVDAASGTGINEIVEEMKKNSENFYRFARPDGIMDMADDDDDGQPDVKGVVKTAVTAIGFPESLFDI